MGYEVLARKYRSRTFDEIVGQQAIATTLKNAVETGRIHHGYLFTGTRGVGKTSMARILAKALNCFGFDAPTSSPCCECESCRCVAEGEDLDVVEIDAASNTGVDNIRELRSNAAYRPARSRYKIYIIDEVHMLSTGAFNALLKTLEEPPEHVKFILATTESHKVPATIQSRCQRFDFRSISPADIGEQLSTILEREGITAEESVIRRVARLANGSMRDALSLLDQLLSHGTGEVTEALMEDLLPTAHDEVIGELFVAVSENDPAAALACVERTLTAGHTPERLCDAMIDYLRSLMLLAVCGAETDLLDLSKTVRSQLAERSSAFDAATYVYMIGLLEEVRRQVKSSSAPRALVDAAVVRLALSSAFSDIGELLRRLDSGAGDPAPSGGAQKKKADSGRQVAPAAAPRQNAVRQPAPQPASKSTGPTSAQQRAMREKPLIRKALELSGGSITQVIDRVAREGAASDVADESEAVLKEEA